MNLSKGDGNGNIVVLAVPLALAVSVKRSVGQRTESAKQQDRTVTF